MGRDLQKATVSLGGTMLAGSGSIVWKFTTGVHPYMTTMSVHESKWEKLKAKKGQPINLVITNSYGVKTTIEKLYILEEVPSGSPHIVSFSVADVRWKWNRKIIVRDYNMSKRTADKNFDNQTLPVDNKQSTPKYDYRPFSLYQGEFVWKAEECLKDFMETMIGEDPSPGSGGSRDKLYKIDSLGASGEFSLQNISISDPGNLALQRLLSFIPGTNVWIDQKGVARFFNTLDVDKADNFIEGLPPSTWDGDKHERVERLKIRPNQVNVYYEREWELLLQYEDDWRTTTQSNPVFNEPWVENVIPTVFEETTVNVYDYEENKVIERTVPPGTWVNAKEWLRVHNELLGPQAVVGAMPWTFKTLRVFWIRGDLEGRLLGTQLRGKQGEVDTTNARAAIQALREHFRTTFMISRRWMERLRDVKSVRVTLIDPVTGTRMPSSVWGQITVAPTTKGTAMFDRKRGSQRGASAMYYLVDNYPENTTRTVENTVGPETLNFIDRDAGIFKLTAGNGTYGTYNTVIPGNTVNAAGEKRVAQYDLGGQDENGVAVGAGMRLQNGTNEWMLPYEYKFRAMITIVPGAPNNIRRMHREVVDHDEMVKYLNAPGDIAQGQGPPIDIFIPSAELTARYAWSIDDQAKESSIKLLGLDQDDPTLGGLEDNPDTKGQNEARNPEGMVWVNEQREIYEHSRSVAAEILSHYIDATAGRITTRVPTGNSRLGDMYGNMTSASISVDGAPSAKVRVTHDFGSLVTPVSRLALMPESARKVVLGIVRFE
jgi:hypothetical protein